MHVLMVCTGNVCRSPTAERLLLAHAARLGVAGLTVRSAGTRAMAGHGMEANAHDVLLGLGGDPAHFRARQLTAALSTTADLVLTMSTRHRAAVLGDAPRAMRRTFTLLEAERLLDVAPDVTQEGHPTPGASTLADRLLDARGRQPQGVPTDDIADPIGRDRAVFDVVGAQIDRACAAVARAIAAEPAPPVPQR